MNVSSAGVVNLCLSAPAVFGSVVKMTLNRIAYPSTSVKNFFQQQLSHDKRLKVKKSFPVGFD